MLCKTIQTATLARRIFDELLVTDVDDSPFREDARPVVHRLTIDRVDLAYDREVVCLSDIDKVLEIT